MVMVSPTAGSHRNESSTSIGNYTMEAALTCATSWIASSTTVVESRRELNCVVRVPQKKSIYQIGLQLARGRRYHFYVYLMGKGHGTGFVELDSLGGTVYGHKDFGTVPGVWRKYEADFTATEDTVKARLSIGFAGEGTFWMDSASLMPADNLHGMRRDVVDAMRAIHIPLMRYPGGCFADYYHWENGIGDRDKRPDVFGDAWKEWDPNDFGTDEFMAMAEELHFAPQLTSNYLSGTPEEAARWVQYLNAGT